MKKDYLISVLALLVLVLFLIFFQGKGSLHEKKTIDRTKLSEQYFSTEQSGEEHHSMELLGLKPEQTIENFFGHLMAGQPLNSLSVMKPDEVFSYFYEGNKTPEEAEGKIKTFSELITEKGTLESVKIQAKKNLANAYEMTCLLTYQANRQRTIVIQLQPIQIPEKSASDYLIVIPIKDLVSQFQ
ncbi:hypothetical protein ACWKT5_37065 [Streptomyces avermitilis]